MAVIISILAILIFIPNYVSAFRELKQDGVPHPNLVIRKRFIGFFRSGKRRRESTLVDKAEIEQLKNHRIWLSWDIRWVSAGTGLGKIVDVNIRVDKIELVIEMLKPLAFGTGDSRVIFEPYNQTSLIKRNRLSSAFGVLRTTDKYEEINKMGQITCELVTI
jgi:hypothetical protein